MFQICNEILLVLFRGPKSISAIAEAIGSNKVTVMRAVNALIEQNIVDHELQGRNKIISLKKNISAKNSCHIAEIYKFNKVLEKYPKLRIIIPKILENAESSKMIILFGSYAKSIAKKDSDIDIYIETGEKRIKNELKNNKLSIKIGEFDQKNLLVKEIIKNHVIIKGIERFYEKTKFFG